MMTLFSFLSMFAWVVDAARVLGQVALVYWLARLVWRFGYNLGRGDS